MNFDQLNKLYSGDFESIMEHWFGEMDITEEQKENRKRVARSVRDLMMLLFMLITTSVQRGAFDYAFILTFFREQLRDIVNNNSRDDDFLRKYVDNISDELLAVTVLQAGIYKDPQIESYWLSEERADIIGLNEANSIMNYEELQQAIDDGYTKKQWKTMRDRKVRRTHSVLDDKVIPIEDFFEVGNSLMMMPHDPDGDPEEVANCRCTLRYL